MVKRSFSKKPLTMQAAHASSIPTTIKNPDRVAYRRNELIEVATSMFLERGFHNTSIRDIVRACSFNVASLYMYVSSKEDILYLVAQDLMNNIAHRLLETPLDEGSPERSLRMGFTSYCQIAHRFRRHIRLLYREVGFLPEAPRSNVLATVSDVTTYFETIIDSGIEAGVFRKVPARIAALDAMMMAHMIALHTREVLTVADLEQYISIQIEALLSGLLTAPKQKRSTVHLGNGRTVRSFRKPVAGKSGN